MCFCTVCRYAEFYLFHQQVFRDVKKREKQSLIPDFPPRYSKSALGISLSHSELKDRTEKLEKYFKAMIAIIDDLSPDSQSLFRALLGGRVSTMVSPALVTQALADDSAEDAGPPPPIPEALVPPPRTQPSPPPPLPLPAIASPAVPTQPDPPAATVDGMAETLEALVAAIDAGDAEAGASLFSTSSEV